MNEEHSDPGNTSWEDVDLSHAKTTDPKRWGPWSLDRRERCLVMQIPEKEAEYRIDLGACLSASGVCFFLFQVDDKGWGEASTAGLVRAFRAVLQPHRFLQGGEQITTNQLRQLVNAAVDAGAPIWEPEPAS